VKQADVLAGPRILELRKIADERGNLTPIEANVDVPFEIRRVYYLYDVPGGESRAGHAHRTLQQVIIAASGSFDVTLDNGSSTEVYQLNRSYRALYVPPMQWRLLSNFSSGSVCLVLASEHFDESDYYRDHDVFLRAVAAAR
jgi:hypothetical protein